MYQLGFKNILKDSYRTKLSFSVSDLTHSANEFIKKESTYGPQDVEILTFKDFHFPYILIELIVINEMKTYFAAAATTV